MCPATGLTSYPMRWRVGHAILSAGSRCGRERWCKASQQGTYSAFNASTGWEVERCEVGIGKGVTR